MVIVSDEDLVVFLDQAAPDCRFGTAWRRTGQLGEWRRE
jgi:hypothetical protein